MGQVALGFRSLFFRALIFFIMAALLAWALGGTLWPKPVCGSLDSVEFGDGQWTWDACMNPSSLPPDVSPLKYMLVVRDQSGKALQFDVLKDQFVVDILPLRIDEDRLMVFICEQKGSSRLWRQLVIDKNGSVVKDEQLTDRLAAVKSWSSLSVSSTQ